MQLTKEEAAYFGTLRKRIGANILTARRNKKLSLYRLSKEVGINSHNLDLFELGKKQITIEKLIKISSVLGVSPEHLMNE